jgi:hypothetical protein
MQVGYLSSVVVTVNQLLFASKKESGGLQKPIVANTSLCEPGIEE